MNKNLFKDKLENNEFIYTSEVSPERGTDLSKIKIILKSLKDKITAFNGPLLSNLTFAYTLFSRAGL